MDSLCVLSVPQIRLLYTIDGIADSFHRLESLWDWEHYESVEHSQRLYENAGFAGFFVCLLEKEVIWLEDFVGAIVNTEIVDTTKVAEYWADPRVLCRQLPLPDGVEDDDTVELQHGVFVL